MKQKQAIITPFGERGIRISWDGDTEDNLLHTILQLKSELQKLKDVDVINTYRELLLIYPFPIHQMDQKTQQVQSIIQDLSLKEKLNAKLFHLPICYHPSFALDTDVLCSEKNISSQDLIRLHTSTMYTLSFIGFLPGFLYLEGLDTQLHMHRKKSPRKSIQKGAVGIAGSQTGIYPKASPGGWQIIGNCPLDFFDAIKNPPSPFKAGDRICFFEITLQEHKKILHQLKAGKYKIKSSSYVY